MVSKKFRVESLQSEEEENTLILVFDTKNTLGPTYLKGLFFLVLDHCAYDLLSSQHSSTVSSSVTSLISSFKMFRKDFFKPVCRFVYTTC